MKPSSVLEVGQTYSKKDKEKRFHFDDFTDNANLVNVYRWNPSDAGMTTKSKIYRTRSISDERKRKYEKPGQTERKGLVT